MTTPPTTDAAKLREAANWVLQQDDNCEQDELLARHVLATVPEDGEEKCVVGQESCGWKFCPRHGYG